MKVVCNVCRKPPLTKTTIGEYCQRGCTGYDCTGRYNQVMKYREHYIACLWGGPLRGKLTQVLLWWRWPLMVRCGTWPFRGRHYRGSLREWVCFRYWIVGPIEVRRFK